MLSILYYFLRNQYSADVFSTRHLKLVLIFVFRALFSYLLTFQIFQNNIFDKNHLKNLSLTTGLEYVNSHTKQIIPFKFFGILYLVNFVFEILTWLLNFENLMRLMNFDWIFMRFCIWAALPWAWPVKCESCMACRDWEFFYERDESRLYKPFWYNLSLTCVEWVDLHSYWMNS